MKRRVNIKFEEDPALEEIEVCIRASTHDSEIDELIRRINGTPEEYLTAADESGAFIRIPPGEIILISVSGKILEIVTENGRYAVRQSLSELEKTLDENRFVRISRYEIVNIEKILKFDFTLGGMLRLELAGGLETWASRRSIPQIRKKLTERK